jgi:hypothetical protein
VFVAETTWQFCLETMVRTFGCVLTAFFGTRDIFREGNAANNRDGYDIAVRLRHVTSLK